MAREICADCGREPVDCTCRQGDQRDRFPGQMRRYRVGAYVEFDVWAGDQGEACIIATHLGIPDATMEPCFPAPLTMEGKLGRNRITADAVRMRCLSVHEHPEVE